MALLTREEIVEALERLGELAQSQGQHIELVAVGGAVMVLAYNARQATHDVDVAILCRVKRGLCVTLLKKWRQNVVGQKTG